MTTAQRHFAGFTAVGIVALLSWLTISPGAPQIYAPLNLLVMLPAFISSSYIVAVAVVPIFFCFWCWPVLRGGSTLLAVQVFGPDKGANLAFVFVNKTQEEIATIKMENLGKKILIQDGGKVRAVGGAGGGLVEGTNTIGLVLIFESKAEAKIAAKVLRGQKDE
jgi:hypothetical protein